VTGYAGSLSSVPEEGKALSPLLTQAAYVCGLSFLSSKLTSILRKLLMPYTRSDASRSMIMILLLKLERVGRLRLRRRRSVDRGVRRMPINRQNHLFSVDFVQRGRGNIVRRVVLHTRRLRTDMRHIRPRHAVLDHRLKDGPPPWREGIRQGSCSQRRMARLNRNRNPTRTCAL